MVSSHRYDGADESTFHNVDLNLQPGELLAVLGASGSGKSTFLRCIAGLEEPSGGRITIDGVPVVESGRERVPAEHRGIGMVFQDYALFPAMTVRENIAFGLRDPVAAAEAVSRWAKLLRLEDLLERRPASLSGGQQQRVALARALAPHLSFFFSMSRLQISMAICVRKLVMSFVNSFEAVRWRLSW